MNIRRAEEKDSEKVLELLSEVLEIHADIRPDLFISGTTKYSKEELLKNDEITGYLNIEEDNPKVTVTTSGINETVFKYVVEEITQTTEIVKNTACPTLLHKVKFWYVNVCMPS